ncbi:hypothetical protein ACHAWF_009642 [Thalassiosira exigua]
MMICSSCNESLGRDSFSRNQLTKGAGRCRCKSCVGAASSSKSRNDAAPCSNNKENVANGNGNRSFAKRSPSGERIIPKYKRAHYFDVEGHDRKDKRPAWTDEMEAALRWKWFYSRHYQKASKGEAEELLLKMFQHFWKADRSAASEFTEAEGRRLLTSSTKNYGLVGEWLLKYGTEAYNYPGGFHHSDDDIYHNEDENNYSEIDLPKLYISIRDDLSSARLELHGDNYNDFPDEMELSPKCNLKEDDEVEFTANVERWDDYNGHCDDHEYALTVTIKYIRSSDTIEGKIRAVPSVEIAEEEGRPTCDYGGAFSFVGRRYDH